MARIAWGRIAPCVAALALAAATPASAQAPEQVADINPGDGSALSFGGTGDLPRSELTELDGFLYFGADDGTDGDELWRSNGTTTEQVADIKPGDDESHSMPRQFTEFEGFLYFTADGTFGFELWRTDGTTTEQVEDINPGAEGSSPHGFAVLGRFLYFAADDGADGHELWRTNGTTTEQVEDINPGAGTSSPGGFTRLGAFLYFHARDGVSGWELWRTNGTTTEQVEDINPGPGDSFATEFTELDDFLYFRAEDGASGRELWRTNGTTTEQVEDINPGDDGSQPSGLMRLGSFVYFGARPDYDEDTGDGDGALWRTDGTTTEQFDDIAGGFEAEPIDGFLYFAADDGTHGYEPWRTDGTTTQQIADINPGPGNSWEGGGATGNRFTGGFTKQGTFVYFAASETEIGTPVLWRTDGTTTEKVLGGGAAPVSLTSFDGSLYYAAGSRDGRELWRIGPGGGGDPDPDPGEDPPPAGQAPPPAPEQPLPVGPLPPVGPRPVVVTPVATPKVGTLLKLPSSRRCVSRRNFTVRVRREIRGDVEKVTIFINGKRVKRVTGTRIGLPIDLRGLPKGKVKVRLRVELADGRVAKDKRTYRTCAKKKRKGKFGRKRRKRG